MGKSRGLRFARPRQVATGLPTSEGIITALNKIVKAFEDTIQVQLIKERWEEIKSMQTFGLAEVLAN